MNRVVENKATNSIISKSNIPFFGTNSDSIEAPAFFSLNKFGPGIQKLPSGSPFIKKQENAGNNGTGASSPKSGTQNKSYSGKASGQAGYDVDFESTLNLEKQKGGQSMSTDINAAMQESFVVDFNDVAIHNNNTSIALNNQINAKAFTNGNHIFFNKDEYQPDSNKGKHLLAHELTHVVQQSKLNENVINRSVNDNSTCDNSFDRSAPPNPLISIILLDSMAGMHLNMAKLTLTLDMMQSSGIPAGKGFDAYRRRFGDPAAVRNKFRNRFNGSLFDTLVEAQISEMNSLISILDRLSNVLARDINYRCIGPHVRTIGGVRFDCSNSGFALTSFNGVNRIIICPAFWNLSAGQQGIGIIHEAVHILFPFGDHDTNPAQTSNERRTEPECYASLVADINNVQPFDSSCPPV